MRIMLAMNLCYEPALGGANKANRILAETLARRGDSVRVVVPSAALLSNTKVDDSRQSATSRNLATSHHNSIRSFRRSGVQVYEVDGPAHRTSKYLARELEEFRPDCVLISSEDPMQLMLQVALEYCSSKVLYLAHTPSCLPFGPCSFDPSERRSLLFARIAVVLAVSRFCADYIREWSQLRPVQLYLPIYGTPPYPNFGQFGRGYVTFVNSCTYKGIDIFLGLARAFPLIQFAAVTSWGTTRNDRERMQQLPNIEVLEAEPDIDIILSKTSVLLVPSIWLENFPMVVIEAMLRGIPVIASNVGGVPEAKLGTNYILPVQPIQKFTREWDERKLWVPVVPVQDCLPWCRALSELTSGRIAYERESAAGKWASERFVAGINWEAVVDVIDDICRSNT